MRKIFTIIISIILICLIGLGTIGYFVEKNEAKKAEEYNNTNQNEQQVEEEKYYAVLDTSTLDINKIEGYTPGGQVENTDIESSQEENSHDINQDTVINQSSDTTTVGGIELPYAVPYKNIEILSIGQYEGKFIEDGSDAKKDNVLAMVIKNTSDEVIDYCEMTFKIRGKSNTIKFKITNLKPGASTLVMESTGEVEFNENNTYIYSDSVNNTVESMSLMEPQVKITTKDGKITIENISEEDLNTVYVYYKTISSGGSYLGGITYRAKFDNVKPGKNISADTSHFSSKNCEIVKVESVKE